MRRFLTKRPKVERAAIEGALLTWLTARRPGHMIWAVVGVIAFGTVGYMAVGDVDLIDGLYMAVITVSTVGYGDLVDTDAGRLFAVFYIILGVGVVSLTISTFARRCRKWIRITAGMPRSAQKP